MNALRTALLAVTCFLFAPVARAAQDDAKPMKATVQAPDGLTIAYDVRGKGDTALVFIHGWCCDREYWKHQLDAFAADNRVVAIDVGGHGASGKDRKAWSIAGLAGDVEAVVKKLGLKRVILVGHSMGGPVSLASAKRMPGTVVAVIGVDTLHNAEFQWPEDQAKMFMAAFEADFKKAMQGAIRMMLPEKTDAKLVEWIVTRAEAQDPKTAVAIFRDFPSLDAKALLKEAKVPVRCINAAPSTKFAIPTATDINKKYADFKAVIMEDVGHYPMLERPAEFNQKLREVLKEFAANK
ncbi:MAG: alpha/beta hydrolase [Gemmataceae bacterium]|nr:alpha/beta hydrolase [Gemmataceae bacterium]